MGPNIAKLIGEYGFPIVAAFRHGVLRVLCMEVGNYRS
jgi:hypothetical protein